MKTRITRTTTKAMKHYLAEQYLYYPNGIEAPGCPASVPSDAIMAAIALSDTWQETLPA